MKKEKIEEDKVNTALIVIVLFVCMAALAFYAVTTGYSFTGVPNYCADSDGKNFYKIGNVEVSLLMEKPVKTETYKDYCSDDMTVVEYYCVWEEKNLVYSAENIEHSCELGCREGACIQPAGRFPRVNLFIRYRDRLKKIFRR